MNNRKNLLIMVVVGILIITGLVFLLLRPAKIKETKRESILPKDQLVQKLESSVEVDVKKLPDGKKVLLSIVNIPSKYTEIEYEFSYDTDKGVPRGVLGTIQVKGDTYEKEIVLGSCSTNTCTYDTGVKKIKISLKFNSASGAKVFEKEFTL